MEIWVPRIEIVALGSLPFALLWFASKVRRSKYPKGSVVAQAAGILASLPLWAMSFFLFTDQGCEEDRALIGSPNGKHVARLMIWGSVPTGTSLRIIERRSWSPVWHQISTAGSAGTPLEPIEPRIQWLDDHRLVLDYPAPIPQFSGSDCTSRLVDGIQLICRTHPFIDKESEVRKLNANP